MGEFLLKWFHFILFSVNRSRIAARDPISVSPHFTRMRPSWSRRAWRAARRPGRRWSARQRIGCWRMKILRGRIRIRRFQMIITTRSTWGTKNQKLFDTKYHFRVDRPMNYRKPFTQTDNIKPTSSIPNFKTLQNITYKSWPIQNKERYHWAINGIKHTTLKNCTGLAHIFRRYQC